VAWVHWAALWSQLSWVEEHTIIIVASNGHAAPWKWAFGSCGFRP
jgi:hypothetical protein